MNRSRRRYLTEKKAATRWRSFSRFLPERRTDTLGRYRKAKGCECRECSYRKQAAKHAASKGRRQLFKDMIRQGMS